MNRSQLESWTIPVIVFSIATLVALVVRQIVLRTLDARSAKGHQFGRLLVDSLRGPSVLWCIAAGLAVAIHNAEAPRSFDHWAQKSIGVFLLVSVGLVSSTIAVRMIGAYGERKSLRIAGLSRTLVNLFIFSIVLLMVLSEFEVKITPILTALGVGGLAVALALQDSLANFFAGVHILLEEPLRVGDFVTLSKDEEGTVRDIGWRTTRIQTGSNSIIFVPNQKITSGIVTNHSLPDPRVSTDIVIVAAHDADPGEIAAVAIDAASDTPGVLDDPAPAVVFEPGLLNTHMQMKLVVNVANVHVRGRVQSEIRARLHRAFIEKGIPFPVVKP